MPSATVNRNPTSVLYRDVLEIAFGFLPLSDLASIVAVSRRWFEAATHMNVIGAVTHPESNQHSLRILQSRLVHHVAVWYQQDPVSVDDLVRIADRASSLTYLDCQLAPQPSDVSREIRFPPRLQSLGIIAPWDDPLVVARVAAGVSALTQLRRLFLVTRTSFANVSLDCLLDLPHLEELTMRHEQGRKLVLQPGHIETLRNLPQLTSVDLSTALTPEALQQLVRSPVPASMRAWKTVCPRPIQLRAAVVACFQRLPALTYLDGFLHGSISVLSSWPQLTWLDLDLENCNSPAVEIAAALQGCVRLTLLAIHDCELSDADLTSVLPALPALNCLRLSFLPQLVSFSPFALVTKLTELDVAHCSSPALVGSELRHLHGLAHLTDLHIYESCVWTPSDEAEIALLQPPSSILPNLTSFLFDVQSRREAQAQPE